MNHRTTEPASAVIGHPAAGDAAPEMVTRVSEALREECLRIFGATWNNDNALRFALVAIKAMREPTEQMLEAAWSEIIVPPINIGEMTREELYKSATSDRYSIMIDASLKEYAR